jgi:lipoprotein-anchoring transpeptidase ErfK/SrfK
MRGIALLLAASIFAFLAGPSPARADVVAVISLSDQRMTVKVNGFARHVWAVSTARRGKITPRGSFRVQTMRRVHYSSLYNNAPMPHSIFFRGNYAIHGTTEVQNLGRPASAGCIRLHPDHARILFEIVERRGTQNVQIVVRG